MNNFQAGLKKKTKFCRLLSFFILTICFCTEALYAQEQVGGNITVKAQNETLSAVFKKITDQSGYTFFYDEAILNNTPQVNVSFSGAKLQTVLDELSRQSGLAFNIRGKTITVSKKAQTGLSDRFPSKSLPAKGTVTDSSGETLIGVSITLKADRSKGTVSDMDGNFTLESVPQGSTLLVSYVGYTPQEIVIKDDRPLQIVLSEDTKILDEVVVIGYGVQRKRDVTTSISQVKAEDIADRAVTDFRQALVGKMPGVQVLQPSGDPEGAVSIRVRGISSATAGNDPLYIIDGMPVERGLANLNNNDIESIEVLKDASSAAIYGSRGSNGVVIITTKQGRSEKLTVQYDGYYGLSQVSKKLPMMNAYQFAQAARDGHNAAYLAEVPAGSVDDPNSMRPQSYHQIPNELFPYKYYCRVYIKGYTKTILFSSIRKPY